MTAQKIIKAATARKNKSGNNNCTIKLIKKVQRHEENHDDPVILAAVPYRHAGT